MQNYNSLVRASNSVVAPATARTTFSGCSVPETDESTFPFSGGYSTNLFTRLWKHILAALLAQCGIPQSGFHVDTARMLREAASIFCCTRRRCVRIRYGLVTRTNSWRRYADVIEVESALPDSIPDAARIFLRAICPAGCRLQLQTACLASLTSTISRVGYRRASKGSGYASSTVLCSISRY
jgi:hypothetical protein